MKKQFFCYIAGIYILIANSASAQNIVNPFQQVDEYVKSLGKLDTLNMGTISYIVTKKFPGNIEKVRAIFDWIAYNISFDCKAARNNGNEKTNSEDVLKFRKTTAMGYASLFQDMCSVIKIRCLTVDGYAKYSTEEIKDPPEQFNHTWVVVQLGQSEDNWHYIDPTWGSGYTDEKLTLFTPFYNDAYFFAQKAIFNFQHYPDNKAWQLGGGPKSQKDFFSLPLIQHRAYEFGVTQFSPSNGLIKSTTQKPVYFSFATNGKIPIDIVALQIGSDKKKKIKTVDYTINKGIVSFNYKFEVEDSYPVTILVNNKPVLGFWAEIIE